MPGPSEQLQPDGVCAPLGEEGGGLLGGGAVEAVAGVVYGNHDDDWDAGELGAGGEDGLLGLGHGGQGFGDEEIDADEGADLLGVGLVGFRGCDGAGAEGADGAGDEGLGRRAFPASGGRSRGRV